MEIYGETKDTEMENIGLGTCEHFFRGLVIQCLRYPGLNIYDAIFLFSLKEFQQLLIMEHDTCRLYNGPVLSFNDSILFRSIGNNFLFLDTFLLAKIKELI